MNINYDELNVVANNVASNAADYDNGVKGLYNEIEELKTSWSGDDNQQFVTTVEGYKKDLLSLGEVLKDYALFINETVDLVRNTQSNIKDSASRM